jgi:predicted chitinase
MGRGYVQLTWKSNYEKFGDALHINLVGNPDLALNPTYAGQIIDLGMRKGMFTGVSLSHYINGSHQDFYNARRIINGTDKAQEFADRATKIYRA